MYEELAHDRNQGDLTRFSLFPQVLTEVSVDAFLPNHGQGLAHSRPTTPDRPLASSVATVPRPRRPTNLRIQGLAVPLAGNLWGSGRNAASMAAVKEPTPGMLRYCVACGRRTSLRCWRAW